MIHRMAQYLVGDGSTVITVNRSPDSDIWPPGRRGSSRRSLVLVHAARGAVAPEDPVGVDQHGGGVGVLLLVHHLEPLGAVGLDGRQFPPRQAVGGEQAAVGVGGGVGLVGFLAPCTARRSGPCT